ncbi:MAG: hypothetical protein K0U68_09325 [Gammaproteobacteria bacterium]|nr:hypothetical protein [Gammaproteobacteria bacterium]
MNEQQLQIAYFNSALQTCVNAQWRSLAEQFQHRRIIELLKYLYLSREKQFAYPIANELLELYECWETQLMEFKQLQTNLHIQSFSAQPKAAEKAALLDNDCIREATELLADYVCEYGEFTEDTISYWPLAIQLMQHFEFSLDDFNDWLSWYNNLEYYAH